MQIAAASSSKKFLWQIWLDLGVIEVKFGQNQNFAPKNIRSPMAVFAVFR